MTDTSFARHIRLAGSQVLDGALLRAFWTNGAQVAPGVFRSNSPVRSRLARARAEGIRSVLNLRQDVGSPGARYLETLCRDLGLAVHACPLARDRAPTRDELAGLVSALEAAEKPVLILGKYGADRTGLAAAVWCLLQGQGIEAARHQLSQRFFHFPDFRAGVLGAVLDQFAASEGADFGHWVATDYDPQAADAAFQARRPKYSRLGQAKAVWRNIYRYAQIREGEWHRSFEGPIETEKDRKRAAFFIKWIDHGVLRGPWTNEDEVIPGVIRSNHPTEQRFRDHAAKGLKTVINLRGERGQPQYHLEKKLCEELGLRLVDIPMDAHRPPPVATALAFLDAVKTAEKPLLFHCKSGADRTGIASVLLALDNELGLEVARRHLSFRYVHLKNSSKGVLDKVLDAYEADFAVDPISIREWLVAKYDPEAILEDFTRSREKA